jgi:hypothetical protein
MTLAEIAITSAAVPFRFRSELNRELNSRSSISTLSLPLRASPTTRYSSCTHTQREREKEREREREREREGLVSTGRNQRHSDAIKGK